ncbi:MAG: hypothetical protein AB1847_15740 [bacterium]
MNYSSKGKLLIISSILLFVLAVIPQGNVQAYYSYGYGSSLYGGLYGSSLYGGLYGGLYGSSLYGGLYGGLYGSSLYGGLYGGLYGSSLYGGLYGGLYGSSLYGGLYGGLYGSSLYGGLYGGLYGSSLYGGLYGGLYGSSLYGGLYGGLYGSSLYGGLRYGLAEQAGTWTGTWSTTTTKSVVYATGPITLNLVLDPVLPTAVSGYVQLVGNPVLGVIVDVTGEILNNQIILSGAGLGIGSQTIQIDIVCSLTSPTDMTGTYTQINSTSIIGTGSFIASLAPAVI